MWSRNLAWYLSGAICPHQGYPPPHPPTPIPAFVQKIPLLIYSRELQWLHAPIHNSCTGHFFLYFDIWNPKIFRNLSVVFWLTVCPYWACSWRCSFLSKLRFGHNKPRWWQPWGICPTKNHTYLFTVAIKKHKLVYLVGLNI